MRLKRNIGGRTHYKSCELFLLCRAEHDPCLVHPKMVVVLSLCRSLSSWRCRWSPASSNRCKAYFSNPCTEISPVWDCLVSEERPSGDPYPAPAAADRIRRSPPRSNSREPRLGE